MYYSQDERYMQMRDETLVELNSCCFIFTIALFQNYIANVTIILSNLVKSLRNNHENDIFCYPNGQHEHRIVATHLKLIYQIVLIMIRH